MPVMLWSNGNSHVLTVEPPWKTICNYQGKQKIGQSSNSTWKHRYPGENTWPRILMAALVMTAPKWKQLKCPSTKDGEQNAQVEYYAAMKRMNLTIGNRTDEPSSRRYAGWKLHLQDSTSYIIPFIGCSKQAKLTHNWQGAILDVETIMQVRKGWQPSSP